MQGEADDAGGLAPAKEDNDAMCKSARKEWMLFIKDQYKLNGYVPGTDAGAAARISRRYGTHQQPHSVFI